MQSRLQKTENSSEAGNAIVFGLGKSAVACATFLINEGWDVAVADVNPRPQLESRFKSALPGIPVYAPVYPQLFLNVDLVVMSCTAANSNAAILQLAKEYGVEVVSSLDLFFERSTKPVIAVAGTNGKSTVTTLVDAIICSHGDSVRIGGYRGLPFLELLNKQQPNVFLLELSAMHLEQVNSVRPDVATILNVSPDHKERYSNLDDYVDCMAKVLQDAKIPVINRDDSIVSQLPTSGAGISFGLNQPPRDCDYGVVEDSSGRWIVRGDEKLINLSQCFLKGWHNELNLLAACAIAGAVGYPVDQKKNVVTKFEGLRFSCNDEGEWNGVRWVNDARSKNVGAAIAAIQSNSRPVVLIAGGLSKGADFSQIPKSVNGKLRGCVFFGRDGKEIGKSLKGIAKRKQAEDLYEAIKVAESMTKEGDCVIFSPGCESNDMFTDCVHRGETFSKALQMHFS